jgi:hypothetical protein
VITVFFVPGMFGSTVEFVLRSFTEQFNAVDGKVLDDGSMHSFKKEFHPLDIESITSGLIVDIATPIYPFKQNHFPEILQKFQENNLADLSVLIHANSLRDAELNILFQYHKIANGLDQGLGIFCHDNSHNIVNWNSDYTHWSQMRPWELREWMSLFYVSWVQEWIDSQYQSPDSFIKISNTDLLYNTKNTLSDIIKLLGLTESGDLDSFVKVWTEKQQYIIDEFNLLDEICYNATSNLAFAWPRINVIAEAIVQQRLRALGYEIQCDGLDTFPTDAKTLYKLLEKV